MDQVNRALQKGGRRTGNKEVKEEGQGRRRRRVNLPLTIPSSLSPFKLDDTSRRPRETGIDDTMESRLASCAGFVAMT
jgi:hypothetical protein